MILVFYAFHVALSLFLILVVLLQQGKGADLSVFGGGASQAAFGARGAATLLHKLTVVCFVLFILMTLSINIVQKRDASSVMSGVGSVLDEVETSAPASTDEPVTAPAESDGSGAGEAGEPEAGDAGGNQG